MIPGIIRLIQRTRLPLNNEKATQAELATVLERNGYVAWREHRFSAADIPDFFLPETGIVIEVKLKGAHKLRVFSQLVRYAEHAEVQAIILASNLAMGLPALIKGKPAHYVSLGRAWL